MNQTETYTPSPKGLLFWGALFLVLIYGNSLRVPFIFDDWSGIVNRPELQLTRITPEKIARTFFLKTDEGTRLCRPLSALSLALNYYCGGHQVVGYHLVNLLIHLLTAFFLFKTLRLLIALGRFHFTREETIFIAGLTAILWAAHPIQTQAVTYIIQRMTSLAAMFYVMGLYCYAHFRQQPRETETRTGLKWPAAALALFICAVLSKPNAILFPLGILLLEFFFFNGFEVFKKHPFSTTGLFCILTAALVTAGMIVLRGEGLPALLTKYDFLPFTLKERLLTEPRVLFVYLSQLLYPVPERFSMVHDVPLSTALFAPWSTIWALGGLLLLTGTGLLIGRRYPLMGFPIVFYLSHHLVESSFLPLALVYEHRNYLPSLFFFLPAAAALIYGLRIYQTKSRFIWSLLFLFTTALIFLLGMSTHIRNHDWRSANALWTSALRRAPGVIKPYLALGNGYMQQGNMSAALAVLKEGAGKRPVDFIFEQADVLSRIAVIYYQRSEPARARQTAEESLGIYLAAAARNPAVMKKNEVRKGLAGNYYFLSRVASAGDLTTALDHIDKAMAIVPYYDSQAQRIYFHNIKAEYLIRLGRYDQALETLQAGRRQCPENRYAYLLLGYALTASGHYQQGYWHYRYYRVRTDGGDGRDQGLLLYLAENRYLAGDKGMGDVYLENFIRNSDKPLSSTAWNRFWRPNPETLPMIDTAGMRERMREMLRRLVDAAV